MKRAWYLILLLIIIFLTFGCSEKISSTPSNDGPNLPPMAEQYDLQFIIPDTLIDFQQENVDYNGQSVIAYSLPQFVSEDSVNSYSNITSIDSRILYAVQTVSSDEDQNWSPRKKGYYDLSWDDFKNGFYLPDQSQRLYFPNENILGVYNVKYAKYIRLYRKVDVVKDENITIFETEAFDSEPIIYYKDDVEYNEEGYTIKNFISKYITETPSEYKYQFFAADGCVNSDTNNMFTWDDLQNSYWLTSKNEAIFLDDAMHTKCESVKYLKKIKLIHIDKC